MLSSYFVSKLIVFERLSRVVVSFSVALTLQDCVVCNCCCLYYGQEQVVSWKLFWKSRLHLSFTLQENKLTPVCPLSSIQGTGESPKLYFRYSLSAERILRVETLLPRKFSLGTTSTQNFGVSGIDLRQFLAFSRPDCRVYRAYFVFPPWNNLGMR